MKARFLLIGISLIAISAIFATNIAAQINADDTLGIWAFDEGGGNKAEEWTGKDLAGTLMNDPQWVAGKFGNAISFDGITQFIQVDDPLNVAEFGTSHSMSIWVNPGDEQQEWADILGNHNGDSGGYEFEQRADEVNRFYFGMRINETWQGGPPAERPATLLTPGEWQHFVGVRDGATVKHYLNGQQTQEYQVDPDPVMDSLWDFRFGMSTCCGEIRQFNGSLDEIVIFKKAVSEAEIAALSNGVELGSAVESAGKLTTTWGTLKTQYKPLE